MLEKLKQLRLFPAVLTLTEAKEWIATREAPIGWFETEKEVQNYADKFKIKHRVSAGDLKAARTTLKLSGAAFADKASVDGTPNTRNKFVF